ncbi:MAG: CCA tRNA nucleotidyltransferase [Synergistaceae bacterium]|nr:CCA tRNA nucleotidyltransferase [Synergistaceae bacterium]
MKDLLDRGGQVLRRLEESGYEGVYAGGMVRDLLCGREPRDIDITCGASLEALGILFPKGKILGPPGCEIFLLPLEKGHIQIFSYASSSLEKDLERRDLTVNALALRRRGELVGSPESVNDVFDRRLRFNGRGEDRLAEDPLRALRLHRFAATLPGFRADEASVELCRTVRTTLGECPGERVGREVRLGLEGDTSLFLRGLQTAGLLESVFPGLILSDADFPVMLEVEKVLTECNSPLHLKAAALFSFPEKEQPLDDEGALIARKVLQPFAWGSALTDRISELVRYRNLLRQRPSPEFLAGLMDEKGPSFAFDLVQLSQSLSSSETFRPMLKVNTLILLAMASRKTMEEELLPTGGEILRHFSLSPGRTVGQLRRRAARGNIERGFSDRTALFAFLEKEFREMEQEINKE